jgi:NAD(P)-dependent dehydrogenase (short-subunit alcohol dehydrogenase family)
LSEALARRVGRRLARRKSVEAKAALGGLGLPLDGNLPAGVWKGSLQGWGLAAPEGVQGDGQLSGWIERAVKLAGRLPAKWPPGRLLGQRGERIVSSGGKAGSRRLDLADEAAWHPATRHIPAAHGRLDVLVNNAF